MPGSDHFGNFHRRAFAQIVNIRFECQTKAGNFQLTGAFAAVGQAIRDRGFDLVDDPVRFVVVYFACGANQACLFRVLRHDKPRIDRDAVPTHARPRLKDVHAGVTVGKANKFPDVNPLIGANQRQFIRKRDINVAEAVFGQFAHLGGAGVGHHTFAFKENFIQLAGARGADWRHAANHAVIFNQFHHHLAGQYALRTVGDIDIGLVARLLREAEIGTRLGQPLRHLLGSPNR